MTSTTETTTYALSSCAKCGCAIGFSALRPDATDAERREHSKTVGGWAGIGLTIATATTRDELNAHMQTWGDCECEVGRNDG